MEELDEYGIPIKKQSSVDQYGIPLKKKEVSKPTVQKKPLESPTKQKPTATSLATGQAPKQQASDGLDGAPKMRTLGVDITPEEALKPSVAAQIPTTPVDKFVEKAKKIEYAKELVSTNNTTELKRLQNEGELPPDSELIAKGVIEAPKIKAGPRETLSFEDYVYKAEDVLKGGPIGERQVERITSKDPKDLADYKAEVVKATDLNIKNPYVFYSKDTDDTLVDQIYGEAALEGMNVNPKNFDGFLNVNGYKQDYLKKKELGVFEETGGNPYKLQVALELEKKRMLDLYLNDMISRDLKRKEYNKEIKELKVDDYYKINEEELKQTIDKDQYLNYIDVTMPTLSKKLKESDDRNKQRLQDIYNGKTEGWSGLGYGITETVGNTWNGFVDRINQLATTISPTEKGAEQLRQTQAQRELERTDTRGVGYVGGKTVDFLGNDYLVDDTGNIYDKKLKIRITDTFDQEAADKLRELSKTEGKDDWIFSPQGAAIQLGGVVGDMIVQLAATRGVGLAGKGAGMLVADIAAYRKLAPLKDIGIKQGVGDAIVSQSALGYSSGMENTLKEAKRAGINDREAQNLAAVAAKEMAGLYAITAPLSPQTKAKNALFGAEANTIVRDAIEQYKKIGIEGFKATFNRAAEKIAKGVVEFTEEGAKETIQENIQQGGEIFLINKDLNEQAKKDFLKADYTASDVVNTSILSFISSGLMSQMKAPGLFRNVDVDNLRSLKSLSENETEFNSALRILVDKGNFSQTEADNLKKDVEIYKRGINKIPKNTKPDIAFSLMKDVDELSSLEERKKQLDPAFHLDIDEQIKQKRADIQSRVLYSNLNDKQKNTLKTEAKNELGDNASDQAITDKAVELFKESKAAIEETEEVITPTEEVITEEVATPTEAVAPAEEVVADENQYAKSPFIFNKEVDNEINPTNAEEQKNHDVIIQKIVDKGVENGDSSEKIRDKVYKYLRQNNILLGVNETFGIKDYVDGKVEGTLKTNFIDYRRTPKTEVVAEEVKPEVVTPAKEEVVSVKEEPVIKSSKNNKYDIYFNENGGVDKIVTKKGDKEINKFIEYKDKKGNAKIKRNAGYTQIEAEALGVITSNKSVVEQKQIFQKALDKFTPTNEYEAALEALARGAKVSNPRQETGDKAKWVTDKKAKSIETLSEDIWMNYPDLELDQQEVRDQLIDIINTYGSLSDVRNQLVNTVSEESERLSQQETYEFLNSLSEKERAMYEDMKAEDDYISELSDEDAIKYYEQQYEEQTDKVADVEGIGAKEISREVEKKITAAEAKIDDIANWLKENLPGADINPSDYKAQGFSQNQLIDIIADAAKKLAATGIEISEAINQVIETLKQKFDFDVDVDLVREKLIPPVTSNDIKEIVSSYKANGFSDLYISNKLKDAGFSPKESTDAILDYNKQKIKEGQKKEKVFIKEGRNIISKFLDNVKRRAFSARAFLPKSVFISKENKESRIAAEAKKASYLVKDFDKKLSKYEGDKDALIVEFDKYVRGEEANLPIDFLIIAKSMRIHVDRLSQELIDSGAVDEYQAERITENLGKYLTRSYEVFDKKDWAKMVSKEALQSAKNFFKQQLLAEAIAESKKTGMDVDTVLEKKAENAINELINREGSTNFISTGKTGSKDISILKEKKDIPLELRQLMGEYTDPTQNYSRTIFKIASLVENAKFLNEVKKNGLGVFFFNEGDINKPEEFNTQIAAEGSETMNPLNGLYTTKEIADAFNEASGLLNAIKVGLPSSISEPVSSAYEYYMKLLSGVKWAKTIGSVATHGKNVSGNVTFMLANGYLTPDLYRTAAKVVYNDFRNKSNEELRTKMNEYIEAGIVGQSATLGEIRAMFKDANFDKTFERRMTDRSLNPVYKFMNNVKKFGAKIVDKAELAYQSEDDYFKIVAYEAEKARYSDALYGKDYSQLTKKEQSELTNYVSEIVKNVLPNYGRVGGAVKFLKSFPIAGTFISFQTEALRTAYNTVQLAIDEVKSKNPKIRKIGAKRMAGIIASQGIKYGLMYLIGQRVSGDDDDETKKKAKKFVAPWSKKSNIIISEKGDGKFSYVDISASDPHGGIAKIINSALQGKDPVDGFISGLEEIVSPFTNPDILGSTFTELKNNKDATGRPIYNEYDTNEDKLKKISARLYKTLEPGTVTSARKIYESDEKLNDMTGQLFGYKEIDVDVADQFSYKISEIKKKETEARNVYNKAFNKFNRGEIKQEELDKAYNQSNKVVKELYTELSEDYDAAVYFGADEQTLEDSMKRQRISKSNTNGIMSGEIPDINIREEEEASGRESSGSRSESGSRESSGSRSQSGSRE